MKEWAEITDKERSEPKFLARGTKVMVNGKVAPIESVSTGRYGQRKVYILMTQDYGRIFVSPTQLIKISEAFNGKFDDVLTVEL